MGTYCNEADIEGITQFTINATTNPTTTQVATWITQIEADVDARALGSYTVTDELVDVNPTVGYPARNTIAWLRSIARDRYGQIDTANIISLPRIPIVSIGSLSRRTSSLGATDAWAIAKLTEPTEHLLLLMEKEWDYSEQEASRALFDALKEISDGYPTAVSRQVGRRCRG